MRIRTWRCITTAAAVAAAGLLLPGTAGAVPPANGTPETITAAISPTALDVTSAIFAAINRDPSNTDPDTFVIALPTVDCNTAGMRLTDLADSVDVASCTGRTTSPAFEYYAFARDAVTWAKTPTGAA
jgi:phosphate transport system substrate-binding protein